MDGVVEAVRVFGNLSQYHEICDFIVQKKSEFCICRSPVFKCP